MRIYNTLVREKVPFTPLIDGQIRMYVCGPTVYDRAHIGNARPYVIFDTLYRLLSLNYQVTYVRNITDVDDKIMDAARTNGESIDQLTQRTTDLFHEDMGILNILPVTVEPRATQHITEMISMIQTLLSKQHAYEAEGHVLFSVESDPTYGSLANRDMEDMIAGARVEVAPYKRHPADFVLWKPSTPDQPGWESPWGRGRPGWHIECSAMSHKHLGETFDIHGGGQDLLFPHHENEVAQSTCSFGKGTFAKYWMHNGMLMVNGKKMSKSLGNFLTVHDLLQQMPGEVIRYVLLSTHYRQSLDWTDKAVESASKALDRLYQALRGIDCADSQDIDPSVLEALEDDLNTPLALSHLHEIAHQINKTYDAAERTLLAERLKASATLLGLLQTDPEAWFKKAHVEGLSDEEIQSLIDQRHKAKINKDYATADQIRHTLKESGVILEDASNGKTLWKRV